MSSKIGKIRKPEVIALLIAMDHVYDNNEFDYDSVAINEFKIWLANIPKFIPSYKGSDRTNSKSTN